MTTVKSRPNCASNHRCAGISYLQLPSILCWHADCSSSCCWELSEPL